MSERTKGDGGVSDTLTSLYVNHGGLMMPRPSSPRWG
jgi:hypothetical protein